MQIHVNFYFINLLINFLDEEEMESEMTISERRKMNLKLSMNLNYGASSSRSSSQTYGVSSIFEKNTKIAQSLNKLTSTSIYGKNILDTTQTKLTDIMKCIKNK